MKSLSGLFAGLLFGVGLAASGMTDTHKVIGFLDIFGDWNSDLLFVMAAAVITTTIGFTIIFRKKHPLFEERFYLPALQKIDKRLIIGAILFGIGWGLYGYCPGPAIASLAYLSPMTIYFVAFMLMGMTLSHILMTKIFSIKHKP